MEWEEGLYQYFDHRLEWTSSRNSFIISNPLGVNHTSFSCTKLKHINLNAFSRVWRRIPAHFRLHYSELAEKTIVTAEDVNPISRYVLRSCTLVCVLEGGGKVLPHLGTLLKKENGIFWEFFPKGGPPSQIFSQIFSQVFSNPKTFVNLPSVFLATLVVGCPEKDFFLNFAYKQN